jgi:hypothetical protein
MKTIRQGDVALIAVKSLPKGAKEIPLQGNRIVLAFGEVTGHAHAIYDHIEIAPGAAAEIAEAAIARAKARLFEHNGDRYLEVREAVTLRHEEHTHHVIPPGIYELPVQVEHTAGDAVRQVAD